MISASSEFTRGTDVLQMSIDLEEGKLLGEPKQITNDRYFEVDPFITPTGNRFFTVRTDRV